MKILKYGKVVIRKDDILITGFKVDGEGSGNINDVKTAILLEEIKRRKIAASSAEIGRLQAAIKANQ